MGHWNLIRSDSPKIFPHPCRILQKYTIFGGSNTHLSIFLKSLSKIEWNFSNNYLGFKVCGNLSFRRAFRQRIWIISFKCINECNKCYFCSRAWRMSVMSYLWIAWQLFNSDNACTYFHTFNSYNLWDSNEGKCWFFQRTGQQKDWKCISLCSKGQGNKFQHSCLVLVTTIWKTAPQFLL